MKHQEIYDKHMEYFTNKDLDGLMSLYTDDAKLIRLDKTIEEKEHLRNFFQSYMEHLGDFKLLSTDQITHTDESLFSESTVQTSTTQMKMYDVFIIEAKKIKLHFIGVTQVTPLSSI